MKNNSLIFAGGIILSAFLACEKHEAEPSAPETVPEVSEVLNITPDYIGSVTGAEAGQTFECGDTLTLELTPGENLTSGFYAALAEHIHVHVGDTVYMPTFPETDEKYVQKLTVDIAVPNKQFSIIAAYAVQQQLTPDGYTMRLEDNSAGIKLYGVSPYRKYKYFDCYLLTPDAYTIGNVQFKVGDGEWQNANDVTGCSFSRSEAIDRVYRIKVRPDRKNVTGDVMLRVTGEQHERHSIKWLNTEYINTDIPENWQPNILPEEAIDGEKVAAQFYTKDGFYLSGVSTDVEGLALECRLRSYIFFDMPKSDVTVTLDFKKKPEVRYAGGSHLSSAEVYDAADIYYGVPTTDGIPGEAVYLFANAENGYKPSAAKVSGSDKSFPFSTYGGGYDKYQYYAEVILPESGGPFEITAEAAKAYTVSGENFQFNDGTTWLEGETVPFMIYVPAGKTLKGITAKGADGKDVAYTLDNTYGSFVMPACDVTLTAIYEDVDKGSTAHISAVYDSDEYTVFSQTNPYYQRITSEGFDVPAGTTLYVNVQSNYGNAFWVSVKIGDTVTCYKADVDPDFGDASFGKSFVFTADTVIKVGTAEASVKQ